MGRFRLDSSKFIDVGRRECMNRLEGEKQDLKVDSFKDRQPVKLS